MIYVADYVVVVQEDKDVEIEPGKFFYYHPHAVPLWFTFECESLTLDMTGEVRLKLFVEPNGDPVYAGQCSKCSQWFYWRPKGSEVSSQEYERIYNRRYSRRADSGPGDGNPAAPQPAAHTGAENPGARPTDCEPGRPNQISPRTGKRTYRRAF